MESVKGERAQGGLGEKERPRSGLEGESIATTKWITMGSVEKDRGYKGRLVEKESAYCDHKVDRNQESKKREQPQGPLGREQREGLQA